MAFFSLLLLILFKIGQGISIILAIRRIPKLYRWALRKFKSKKKLPANAESSIRKKKLPANAESSRDFPSVKLKP